MFENYYIGRAYRKSKSPLHIIAWKKTVNINKDKIVQLADTDTIENLTSALSQRLIADQLRLTTAESCTGGKLASALCAAEEYTQILRCRLCYFHRSGKDENPQRKPAIS